MLHPYSNRKRLKFNLNTFSIQKLKDIPCRMTGCQNHLISLKCISGQSLCSFDLISLDDEIRHPCVKMDLSTMVQNALAHFGDDRRQLVRSDMRMGFYHNIPNRSKAHKKT